MGINNIPLTDEEMTNLHISGMNDSVAAIQAGINNDASPENTAYVSRNVEHLRVMLEKDFIIGHSCDKTPFTDAIAIGEDYIESN